MKRFVWILLSGLLLVQPGQALKDTPAGPEPDVRRSDFSSELDAFVRQAVDEGLLDPAGTAKPAGEPKSIVAKAAEPEKPAIAAEPALPALPDAPVECTPVYPLDFSEFGQLKSYSDIYAYREDIVAEGEGQKSHAGATLAKAYLALDLASEAAMTVKTGRDQQAVALQNLALLLERRSPAPAAYFSGLAACHPQANLWHALALIAQQDEGGAALLEEHLDSFSELPLQLRDRAAVIAIPALDAMSHGDLAKLLMGTFTDEEIVNSSQLRFSQAVIRLGEGDADAEQIVSDFLVQAHFQEAALAALIRNNRPFNDVVREILLDDMVTRIEQAQQDADVRADLRFVLDELGANSMYLPMMRMAELPSLQSAAARDELTKHLVASLKRDLESDESLRNLAAVEALIKDPGLLDAAPERDELFETATVVAARLGFGGLGDALSAKAKGGEGSAEQRAVLAYRQKHYPELFELAEQYPANQRINRTAALAAIDTRDRAKLALFESRLSLEPDTILALIEQDAWTGHWLVSNRIIQAALELDGEEQQRRVDRVMSLKHLPAQPIPGVRLAMSAIPEKLDRSRESLAQLSKEAP